APQGPVDGDRALPVLRAAALLRLGEIEAARAVVAAMPEGERGPALPVMVSADAINGDVGRTCATVRETVRQDPDAFWETGLVACQALQGEIDQATLGLQLLAEERTAHEKVLALAVDTLGGRASPGEVSQAEDLDPLTLRLLIAARVSLAPALIDSLRPD